MKENSMEDETKVLIGKLAEVLQDSPLDDGEKIMVLVEIFCIRAAAEEEIQKIVDLIHTMIDEFPFEETKNFYAEWRGCD